MKPRTLLIIAAVLVVGSAGVLEAQRRGFGRRGFGRGGFDGPMDDRRGVPTWDVEPGFKNDVFTFVRIRYGSSGRYGAWETDAPDSDLNFTFRLQQLTSLKVHPDYTVLELTDEKLFDYPFIYMIEPGELEFTEEEVVALRRYLLNGGFMMVDDFWGDYEYENFRRQIKRVFPDREPAELPLEHPIFHCVYDLKEKPQIPSINVARAYRGTNRTWEHNDGEPDAHYRAIFDDKGRMMVIVCHNTDLGDGWEREGEETWYFHEFSEKKAYPMGINIVFYAMTH